MMDFEQITQYMESLPKEVVPGADLIIYKNHEVVYRHMVGTSDEAYTKPIDGSELYLMFSMTKVQTMTAFMQLQEKGLISLEDEVSKFLPAYKNLTVKRGGKIVPVTKPLLMKHLVSMQSGLDYDLQRPGILKVLRQKGSAATTREIVDAFIESPLKFEPGDHFLYSLSHDVVAAVIEVVSGMSFGEYLKKNIWEPLGMKRTSFARPDNEGVKDLAKQFIVDDFGKTVPMKYTCDYQLSESYESGGAGLMSCTEDYAILADALACGGVSKDGVRILKAESVETIKDNLLSDTSRKDLALLMGRIGYGYGVGMQVLMEPEKIDSPAPKGIFGWDGAAGSCITMDSSRGISFVYTMHVRNCGYSYATIHPTLRNLIFG